MHSFENEIPFKEALILDQRVSKHLNEKEIAELLNPEAYIGESESIVDNVLSKS